MELASVRQVGRWNMVTSLPVVIGGVALGIAGAFYLAFPNAEKQYRKDMFEQTAWNYRQAGRVVAKQNHDLESQGVAGALNQQLPRPLDLSAVPRRQTAAEKATRRRRIIAHNSATIAQLWPHYKRELFREKFLLERLEELNAVAATDLQADYSLTAANATSASELLAFSKDMQLDSDAERDFRAQMLL